MAIIDTITGYYGFTLDGTEGGTPIDENGQVKRCIIAIVYPVQSNDVDVEISTGKDDWAVQTGDGKIIPCSNPEILYINRDNTIVQFDMEEAYPSNSPCTLVYHSDTASFNIVERSSSRPFEVNAVSGHFAFTVDGYEGPVGENGNVKRILATIPFPYQISAVKVTISNDPSHWGARMGNGSIIPLSNPEIIATNSENVIVKFDMDEWYPSNSPCILVYRSEDASINIEEVDDDNTFHPVNTIIDVPNKMISGQLLDLNIAKVTPWNATNKNINWAVIDGPGRIENMHYLYAISGGEITIRATIENSLEGEDDVNDFVQSFIINADQNVITIDAQPVNNVLAYVNEIDHEIAVVAKATTDHISYQWYQNSTDNFDNAMKIVGATNQNYKIPEDLGKGDYYYFCKLSSDGASSVVTSSSHVHIAVRCTSISIKPSTSTISWKETRQLYITQTPVSAELPKVKWFSNDSDIISVDDNGLITVNFIKKVINSDLVDETGGIISDDLVDENNVTTPKSTVTITAKTIDVLGETLEDSITITVDTFVPVTDIKYDLLEVNPGKTVGLLGTVVPSNATNKNIEWSVLDDMGTGVTITNNVLNVPNTVANNSYKEFCKLRATIKDGASEHDDVYPDKDQNTQRDYNKEFLIKIKRAFIPVTGIEVSPSTSNAYSINESITLIANTINSDGSIPTVSNVIWSLVSGSEYGELSENMLTFKEKGSITLKATVPEGTGTNANRTDFTQQFTFVCSKSEIHHVNGVSITFEHIEEVNLIDEEGNDTGETEIVTSIDNIYDPFESSSTINTDVPLPFTVLPDDATYDSITIALKEIKQQKKVCEEETDQYGTTASTIVPPTDDGWEACPDNDLITLNSDNKTFTIDTSKVKIGMWYEATISFTFINGAGTGINITLDAPMTILCPNGNAFIPLKSVDLVLPSILRTYYPILLSRFTFEPADASIKNPDTGKIDDFAFRSQVDFSNGGCNVSILSPFTIPHLIEPLSLFQWNWSELYLYPWEPGKFDLTVYIANATVNDVDNYDLWNPDIIDYTRQFKDIEILPPYIPVDHIENIPSNIYSGQEVILTPEVSTGGGHGCYNPTWDEEIPSYSDVVWSIVDNSAGATISEDGVLNTTKAGSVTLRATIDSGLAEYIEWYKGNLENGEVGMLTQEKRNYTEDFVITVINPESEFDRPIVTLKLSDNSNIAIMTTGDLLKLCNDKPADYNITIGSKTFAKSDIVEVKFWDRYILSDLNIYDNDRNNIIINKNSNVVQLNINGYLVDPNWFDVEFTWNVTATNGISINNSVDPKIASLVFDPDNVTDGSNIVVSCVISGKQKVKKDEYEIQCKLVDNDENPISGEELIVVYNGKSYTKTTTEDGLITINNSSCTIKRAESTSELSLEISDTNTFNYSSYVLKVDDESDSGLTQLSNTEETKYNIMDLSDKLKTNISVVNDPNVTSLRNFGRNFTGLTKIDRIPETITGDHCLENFLRGATSFNMGIIIPDTVTGEYCCRNFMRDCTGFNNTISIGSNVTGKGCLFGFLRGCTSFNKKMIIPDNVNGESALERFMSECTNFNQPVTIPTNLTGFACMREFMSDCSKFNQPITLPNDVGVFTDNYGNCGRQLCNTLRGCINYCSTITVPAGTGTNAEVSEQTFACKIADSAMVKVGITLTGEGATTLGNSMENVVPIEGCVIAPPYRHITNLDNE